jgi:hypothetical protein
MVKRGRPKSPIQVEQSAKHTREITHDDGIKQIWKYDSKKSTRGPVSVEILYPSNYVSLEQEQEKLPVSKRKYLSPITGKWVGYGRAKQLGLID